MLPQNASTWPHLRDAFRFFSPLFVVFVIGVLICPYLYVVIPMFLFEDSVCVDKIFKPVERWLCESQCSYMQIQVTSIIVCYMQRLCQSWIPKRNWSFQAFLSVGLWKRGFFFNGNLYSDGSLGCSKGNKRKFTVFIVLVFLSNFFT